MFDCKDIRYFVLFVGSARSGSTLVRSLLDAHPNAIIGNELNVIGHMLRGSSWEEALSAILENSESFSKSPIHTDYNYRVPLENDQSGKIRVIGDKKAGRTTIYFLDDPDLLEQFLNWAEAPVRFIHCLRHPLDVIATKWRRSQGERGGSGKPSAALTRMIDQHFLRDGKAARIVGAVGAKHSCKVYHEQLIENPREVLTGLCRVLELTPSPEYLAACETVINDRPHLSRNKITWPAGAIDSIERAMEGRPDLGWYLD